MLERSTPQLPNAGFAAGVSASAGVIAAAAAQASAANAILPVFISLPLLAYSSTTTNVRADPAADSICRPASRQRRRTRDLGCGLRRWHEIRAGCAHSRESAD